MRIFITLAILLFSNSAFAEKCSISFGKVRSEQQWRKDLSHTTQNNRYAQTTTKREKEIKDSVAFMKKEIKSGTPLMEFYPATGVKVRELVSTGGYGSGKITQLEISGLGNKGELYGTLLLPVSGHTGMANAAQWAKTDTYSIVLEIGGNRQTLISNAKSLDFVTVQEVMIPLKKGQLARIYYERSGSGSGGFPEGRIMEFLWTGK